MTKRQYLRVLGNKLRFRVSSEEYLDIMRDMEECFEAGAAEGKTEEEIAAGLGAPAAAAKELSAGRKIAAPAIIKPAACIFITMILHCIILKTEAELFVPMIFLPLLFLVICTSPQRPLQSITEYPADILPLISAALLPVSGIFLQSFFRYAFSEETHKYAGASVIIFITAALLSAALILISCIKTKKPAEAVISGGAVIFTTVTLFRMTSVMEKYPQYQNVIGHLGIAKAFFAVLLLSSLFSLIHSVLDKNSLNTAALYPPLFTLAFTDRLWLSASRIDPVDPHFDIFGTISYEYYLTGGLICTAAVFAAIIILRRFGRVENG